MCHYSFINEIRKIVFRRVRSHFSNGSLWSEDCGGIGDRFSAKRSPMNSISCFRDSIKSNDSTSRVWRDLSSDLHKLRIACGDMMWWSWKLGDGIDNKSDSGWRFALEFNGLSFRSEWDFIRIRLIPDSNNSPHEFRDSSEWAFFCWNGDCEECEMLVLMSFCTQLSFFEAKGWLSFLSSVVDKSRGVQDAVLDYLNLDPKVNSLARLVVSVHILWSCATSSIKVLSSILFSVPQLKTVLAILDDIQNELSAVNFFETEGFTKLEAEVSWALVIEEIAELPIPGNGK